MIDLKPIWEHLTNDERNVIKQVIWRVFDQVEFDSPEEELANNLLSEIEVLEDQEELRNAD